MASCMIPTLKDNILFLAQSSCFPKKPVRFHKTYMYGKVPQHQWFIFALRSEPCPHEIMRLSAQAGARRIQHSHGEKLRFIIITLIDKVSRSMVSRLHHAADGLGVRPRSVSNGPRNFKFNPKIHSPQVLWLWGIIHALRVSLMISSKIWSTLYL